MKKPLFVFSCVFIFIVSLSCASIRDDLGDEEKAGIYAEIKNEYEKLDAFECRDLLEKYIAEASSVTADYYAERKMNWGTLVINSPINAYATLWIKSYRYNNRKLTDPREIYYLLNYMRSFIQFESKKRSETSPAAFIFIW
jgi:hypothetical protein